MKIDNIEVGKTYKSYKELCVALEISNMGGDTKIANLKEFEHYFRYHKVGNKFVIDEKYEDVEPYFNIKGTTGEYIPYMEFLLVIKLKETEGNLLISSSNLAKELLMIHDDFTKCYQKSMRERLSNDLGFELEIVDDFMSSTSDAYNGAIKTIVKNLKNNKVLDFKKTKMVYTARKDFKNGLFQKSITRKASDYEIKKALEIDREIMKRYGKNMKEVILSGNKLKYDNDLRERLKTDLDIINIYEAYEFFTTDEIINNEYSERLLELQKVKGVESKIINKWYASRISVFEERRKKALEKENSYIESGSLPYLSKKERLRIEPNYIPEMNRIQKMLCINGVPAAE